VFVLRDNAQMAGHRRRPKPGVCCVEFCGFICDPWVFQVVNQGSALCYGRPKQLRDSDLPFTETLNRSIWTQSVGVAQQLGDGHSFHRRCFSAMYWTLISPVISLYMLVDELAVSGFRCSGLGPPSHAKHFDHNVCEETC